MSEITGTFDPRHTYHSQAMPSIPEPRDTDPDDKRGAIRSQPKPYAKPQRPAVGLRCSGPATPELTQLQKTKADIVAKVWTESGIPYPAPSPEFFVRLLERAGAGMALVSRAIRSTAIQLRDESNGTSRKQYIRDAASCSRFLSGKVNRFVALEMVEGTAA